MKIIYKDSDQLLNYSIKTDLDFVKELKTNEMIIHFWQYKGFLLGKLDTLLPRYQEATKWLIEHKIAFDIRKQGGLAIVSDEENLNMSFCFSAKDFNNLHKPYECVSHFLYEVLVDFGLEVEIKTIEKSYCPGDYDLSVNGLKIAGIAQYRNKDAIIVSVNLFVSGNQERRGKWIQTFYYLANAKDSTRVNYPLIDISTMTTLSQILDINLDIDVVKNTIMHSRNNICE